MSEDPSEPTTRPVTVEEDNRIPVLLYDPHYSLVHNRFEAEFLERPVHGASGDLPWFFMETKKSPLPTSIRSSNIPPTSRKLNI
jgi:hypothetical protein